MRVADFTHMRLALALVLAPTIAAADPAPVTVAAAAEPEPVTITSVVEPHSPVFDRAYGDKYSREVGVSAGLMGARGLFAATISPQFGWFIADNIEVSTIVSLTRIEAGMDSSTAATAILEPSYHYKIDHKTQMFAGMGFGYAYLSDAGHGATYAVRGGFQFMLGRRGIFAPTVSYEFRTQDKKLVSNDLDYIAAHNALRLNLGYTSSF